MVLVSSDNIRIYVRVKIQLSELSKHPLIYNIKIVLVVLNVHGGVFTNIIRCYQYTLRL